MSEAQSLSAGEPEQIKISLDALQKFFVDAINSIDAEQYREQAKALALSLFDKYVQPYDIPRLPEFIETRLEGVVREAIPMWVDRLFDSLKNQGGKDTATKEVKDAFDFLMAQ